MIGVCVAAIGSACSDSSKPSAGDIENASTWITQEPADAALNAGLINERSEIEGHFRAAMTGNETSMQLILGLASHTDAAASDLLSTALVTLLEQYGDIRFSASLSSVSPDEQLAALSLIDYAFYSNEKSSWKNFPETHRIYETLTIKAAAQRRDEN